MSHCVMRTKDGDGPWTPCPQPAVMIDPDGDALCEQHLELLWSCPDCDWFNGAGNGMPCQVCQAEYPAADGGARFG